MSEMMSILFSDPFFRYRTLSDSSYVLANAWLLRYHRQCPSVPRHAENNHSLLIEVYQSDDPRTVCLRRNRGKYISKQRDSMGNQEAKP